MSANLAHAARPAIDRMDDELAAMRAVRQQAAATQHAWQSTKQILAQAAAIKSVREQMQRDLKGL